MQSKPIKILIIKFLRIKNVFFSLNKHNFFERKESQCKKFTKNKLINFIKSKQEIFNLKESVINSRQNLSLDNKNFHFIRQKIGHYLYDWINQYNMTANKKSIHSLLNIQLREKERELLLIAHIKRNLYLKIMKLKTKYLTLTNLVEANITKSIISIHKTHPELKSIVFSFDFYNFLQFKWKFCSIKYSFHISITKKKLFLTF